MDSYTIPILAVILLIICLIFKWHYSYWTRRGVESLPPLPIFGNYFECFFMQKHFNDTIDEIYCHSPKARYVGFYKFHTPGLVMRDLSLIKRILSGDLCDYYQNDGSRNDNIYLYSKKKFFISRRYDSEMTRMRIRSYFNEDRFREHFPKLKTISQNFIDYIEGSEEYSSQDGFEAKEISSKFVVEAAMSSALNIEACCFTQPESDFLELYQKYFLGKSFKGFFGLVSTWVEKRIEISLEKKIASTTKGQQDSFSTLFGSHNKRNITQCLIALFDVFERCNTLMTYCLYELALNGDMQKKIRNQLKEREFGTDLLYEKNIIEGLPFLDNILFETLRMHSHIFAIRRKCTKQHQLPSQYSEESPPIIVEKGCHILVPIYSIHMDEKLFPEPYYFNPNRYTANKSGDDIRPFPNFWNNSEFCLGFKYGFYMIKLAIAMILSNYQVVLTPKNTGVLTFSKKTQYLSSEEGIWITFTRVS